MDVGNAKQRIAGALTGIDERPDIRVTLGDDAVKGGDDVLEGFQVAQPRHVGPGRIERRPLGRRIPSLLVRILLGNRSGREQPAPARIGRLRERIVCLRGGEVCASLRILLIQLRRVDLRQKLPTPHPRTDIREPTLEIPTRARIDGSFEIGPDASGQRERLGGWAPLWRDGDDRRDRLEGGLYSEQASRPYPVRDDEGGQ